jgi:hypothetical protein
MLYEEGIPRVGIIGNGFRCGIISAHIQIALEGIDGDLIPESPYAALLQSRITESGVCKVEAHILYTHDYSFAGKSLWQLGGGMDGWHLNNGKCRVKCQLIGGLRLYTSYLWLLTECRQLVQRDISDINITELSQWPTAVCFQDFGWIGGYLHESTNGGFPADISLDLTY